MSTRGCLKISLRVPIQYPHSGVRVTACGPFLAGHAPLARSLRRQADAAQFCQSEVQDFRMPRLITKMLAGLWLRFHLPLCRGLARPTPGPPNFRCTSLSRGGPETGGRVVPSVDSLPPIHEDCAILRCMESIYYTRVRITFEDRKRRRVGKECRSRWSPYH